MPSSALLKKPLLLLLSLEHGGPAPPSALEARAAALSGLLCLAPVLVQWETDVKNNGPASTSRNEIPNHGLAARFKGTYVVGTSMRKDSARHAFTFMSGNHRKGFFPFRWECHSLPAKHWRLLGRLGNNGCRVFFHRSSSINMIYD